MRSLVMTVLLAGLCSGCGGTPQAPAGSAEFKARLDAATAISDLSQRDSALAKVAVDAAASNEAEVAKSAVGKISDMAIRDDTKAKVAFKFAKVGNMDEATPLARTISDMSKRNDTLSRLAKGETGD